MKETEVLQQKIDELNARDFSLEAWKTSVIILFERIFGPDSRKIKMIEELDYEYNSWSLRDAKGTGSSMDTCREQGKAILQSAIMEIEQLGLPGKRGKENDSSEIFRTALEENLRVRDYKRLIQIVQSEDTSEEKTRNIRSFFHEMSGEIPIEIISSVLLNPDYRLV